jgi:glycosyltransferase involved in cell wall biosynthesis
MKVLVFAHRLELGGTQTIAVELAAEVRDRFGLDVVLFATPGPAAALAEAKGLRLLPAPDPRTCPSPARMRALRRAVHRERPDLVHVWDWPQCLDALYGVCLPARLPMLCTVMSMTLARFLPRRVPLTFGTEDLVAQARRVRPGRIELLEPPVDTTANAPGVVDPTAFVERHRLDPDALRIVVVSRLVAWLKLEGLLRTVAAVEELARDRRVQLVVVGEGTAAGQVQARADEVNARAGRRLVALTGGLVEPRPAYEAADVVVGMGSSALRALAFGKPLVVVGERGFSLPFTPQTAATFTWQGFYGLGTGIAAPDPLVEQLRVLLGGTDERARLGGFGRDFVVERYALDTVAARLGRLYFGTASVRPSRSALLSDMARTAAVRAAGAAKALVT